MSGKSPRKVNDKKKGRSLKEKQHTKKMRRALQTGRTSNIPPTGH